MSFTGNGITNCYPDQVDNFISITVLSNPRTESGKAEAFIDGDNVAVGTIVERDPVASELRGVPPSHNGSAFQATLHLTAPLATDTTAEQVAAAFEATGATVAAEASTSTVWRVTVTPTGPGTLRLSFNTGTSKVYGENTRQVQPTETFTVTGRPTLSIGDATAKETDTTISFTIALSEDAQGRISVRWRTVDGTALNGSDYESKSGRVTFEPGERQKVVKVTLFATAFGVEEDETFRVELYSPSGRVHLAADTFATGTIEDNALGGQFLNPDERTSTNNFSVTLRFHNPIENVNTDQIKNGLDVDCGAVASVGAQPGKRDYIVTINPRAPDDGFCATASMEEHVTLTLPRLTTVGDGVTYFEITTTVYGPVRFSVNDASGQEGEDTAVQFTVSLNQAPGRVVTVDYATEDHTAAAGNDYTEKSGTLSFGASETAKTVDVPILDDDVDEDEEQFRFTLSNPSVGGLADGTGIGTIRNHDAMPIGLVARFGRAMAGHVVDQVEERAQGLQRPAEGFLGLRGQFRPIAQQLMAAEENPSRTQHEMDPLMGGLSYDSGLGGGVLSVWSRSARSSFAGEDGVIGVSGDVRTSMLGVDYTTRRMIAGLAFARSIGTGTFRGTSSGETTVAVRGVYPWIGYQVSDRVSVWAMSGRGAGGMILTTRSGVQETPMSMAVAAAGTRAGIRRANGIDLAVKADALWVGTGIEGSSGPRGNLSAARATVTRLRTGIEGSRTYTLMRRVQVEPLVEVGIRQDGGDAETGTGIDLGGGLGVADRGSGLGLDLHWRTMIVHQAAGFRERGFAATITYEPGQGTGGLTARLAPGWGASARGSADTLWRAEAMGQRLAGREEQGRLEGEVGYRMRHGQFLGTPRVGFTNSGYGRAYRIGYNLTRSESDDVRIELGVDVERTQSPARPGPTYATRGRATTSW